MSKEKNGSAHSDKKSPGRSLKEKRADKASKRAEKDFQDKEEQTAKKAQTKK